MATIVDVADRAGVSISTVSHVVNGTRRVAEKTRQRVLRAIEETGYRQDTLARSLRRSRTDSVGLVVSDSGQPAFAEMVRGVEREAARAGCILLLANSGESAVQETRVLRALTARRVDGLIVAPVAGSTGEEIDAIRRDGTPVVLLDRIGSGAGGDQVGVENAALMRELVSHLIGHGHRRVALAAGDARVSTIAERREGYEQALCAHGIEPDPDLVLTGPGLAEDTRRATLGLLAGPGRPPAVVCASTETATGVLEAARELGLSIPGDLKVAVFDEFPHADLFEPRLTAVRQPAVDLGAAAMRLLWRRIEGEAPDPPGGEEIRLTPTIVYRTSCGCEP
ncbi:LacI family DNA-binding transcriptional regulator [Streptomyces sp. DSM 44917]|uniref:LacI family DNA-binding transcriptional regulator n=1 Tax=Streptomyces boetiae TaxID=3075541 RepID=A0ABU2LCC6_9ACTN|nr:LacI family DNA-binding transcriptional regulator [Streptomyces sp. DSM 44917]MDT0309230.1 LacI family DNA-binding transcriptional regulator [Streptomyces sp. DSM 44917]